MRSTYTLIAVLFWIGMTFNQSLGEDQKRTNGSLILEASAEEFRKLEKAQKPIDPEQIDQRLLSAAVFHETNRQRQDHDLPRLKHSPKADKAAALHARVMAREEFVSHENPEPGKEKLPDRVKLAGLNPRFSAENVAMTFAIQYEAGEQVYTRSENGQTKFSYQPRGPAIQPHSYLSFAESVVQQWMNSPGHRKNILHPKAEFFGFSGQPATNDMGMDVIYSVQVFFAPF